MTIAAAAPPVLLDLSTSEAETRFARQLALVVSSVDVVPGPPGLLESSVAAQVELLRPVVGDADAAIWLDDRQPGRLVAAVAVVERQRGVVRLVEVPDGAGAEAALAMGVRELLSSLYVDVAVVPSPMLLPAEESAPTALVVESGPVVTDASPPGPRGGNRRVAVSVLGAQPFRTGTRLGGEVAATYAVGDHLWIGPSIGAEGGAHGWWIHPGILAEWHLLVVGSQLSLVEHPWGLQVRPGLKVGVQHALRPWLRARLMVVGLPRRDVVLDGASTRYDSGWAEATGALSWVWGPVR